MHTFASGYTTSYVYIHRHEFLYNYRRQVLQLSDGGVLALDWVEGEKDLLKFKDETPIVIILPGMTGTVCI